LALVVLISALVGVIIAALVGSPQYVKTTQKIKELEKKVKEAETSPPKPGISEVSNEEEKEQTPPQD
ncbi:LapA family protein, partial [Candidatus Margulisiibacteriota bacterium]